ncbi:hypothetical protein [Stappia sp. ES.058]|uniref:hypothetical protein n=1 Tax=Stappia sp. ES.058 TaxID=1881061 RepID=UPI00087A5F43|nr:hypothetical protein [Stappia sp. ES.058]SDU08757.1 hypothetical protein SAMN05428979_1547 [Stappia sp. ES.058]
MADQNKDMVDNLIEFILADEGPVLAEDQPLLQLFNDAIANGEQKLARERLQRAKAGAAAAQPLTATVVDLENARQLLVRAKSGDTSAQITLAARFGDGTIDADLDAIAEDIAELEADLREED